MASNTAIIADRFSADRQRHMMGLQSSFSSVGTVAALIVSGALADLHWHLSFCLFLAGFAILPFAFGLSETSPMDGTPDRRRASFPLSFGLILLCFFGFMSMFVFNVVPTQLPFFLKQTLHITAASRMGLILAMLPVSSAISGRFYARISRRFSLWNMFLFSGVAMLAGFGLLGLAKGDAVVVAGLMLIGLGFGTAFPHVNVVMAQVVPSAARGRAMGVMSSCKYLGLFASPVLLQPVLAGSSYRFTFYFAGCLLLLVALVIRVVGNRLVPGAAEPKGINA
jgi:MFS family permease